MSPITENSPSSSDQEIAFLRMRLAHRAVQAVLGATTDLRAGRCVLEQLATHHKIELLTRLRFENLRLAFDRAGALDANGNRIVAVERRMGLARDDPAGDLRQVFRGLHDVLLPQSTPRTSAI